LIRPGNLFVNSAAKQLPKVNPHRRPPPGGEPPLPVESDESFRLELSSAERDEHSGLISGAAVLPVRAWCREIISSFFG
jgi:hypothetical protein